MIPCILVFTNVLEKTSALMKKGTIIRIDPDRAGGYNQNRVKYLRSSKHFEIYCTAEVPILAWRWDIVTSRITCPVELVSLIPFSLNTRTVLGERFSYNYIIMVHKRLDDNYMVLRSTNLRDCLRMLVYKKSQDLLIIWLRIRRTEDAFK
jgi:hypothetical protein